jgi:hypothetical protein
MQLCSKAASRAAARWQSQQLQVLPHTPANCSQLASRRQQVMRLKAATGTGGHLGRKARHSRAQRPSRAQAETGPMVQAASVQQQLAARLVQGSSGPSTLCWTSTCQQQALRVEVRVCTGLQKLGSAAAKSNKASSSRSSSSKANALQGLQAQGPVQARGGSAQLAWRQAGAAPCAVLGPHPAQP